MFWASPRRGMRGQRNNSLRAQPSGEGPGIENKLQTEMKLNEILIIMIFLFIIYFFINIKQCPGCDIACIPATDIVKLTQILNPYYQISTTVSRAHFFLPNPSSRSVFSPLLLRISPTCGAAIAVPPLRRLAISKIVSSSMSLPLPVSAFLGCSVQYYYY